MSFRDLFKDKNLIKKIVSFLPASRNSFSFENFRGKGFGDDPRYIAEELHRRNPKYKMYWLVENKETELPPYITPAVLGSVYARFALARSSVWISNIKNSYKPHKKKSQLYIQCWHSTLNFKNNEGSAKNLEPDYIAASKYDAGITDLMYSDNDLRCDHFKKNFFYSGKVIKCDVPRVGAVIKRTDEFKKKIREQYCIEENKKIAVYMPTFRKAKDADIYDTDFEDVAKALKNRFGSDFVILMKLHPNLSHLNFKKYENAVDVTTHVDPFELIGAADVVISDYSGIIFEAIVSRKPLFLIAKDFKSYIEGDRGFMVDPERLPTAFCESDEELISCIENFDKEEYDKKCSEFEKYVGYSDGLNGAERIADYIEEFLKKK